MLLCISVSLSLSAFGQTDEPVLVLDIKTRPARIEAVELKEFATLPDSAKVLIETALAVARQSPWLPYLTGGADPSAGGFDCSGAMYYVLHKAGYLPPRSSGTQMEWIKKNGVLHEVSSEARDLTHPSLAALKPGDLLFWARIDPKGVAVVHHVEMFLGTEKKDGRSVMIGSTDGRSYRGQKANGYGMHDFRVPKIESDSKLVGYGTPVK